MANKKITTAFAYMFAVVIMLIMTLNLSSINASAVSLNLTISKNIVNKDTAITVTANASGGSGYQYRFSVKTPTSNFTSIRDYSSSNTCSYTPAEKGTYYIRVDLSSTGNSPVSKDISFTVVDLVNTSSISSNLVEVNSSLSLIGSATGGSGNYQFLYEYTEPQTTDIKAFNGWGYVSTSSVPFVPNKTGTYKIYITAKDTSTEKTIRNNFNLTVQSKNVAELTNNSSVATSSLQYGTSVILNGSATGGEGNYQYKYTYIEPNSTTEQQCNGLDWTSATAVNFQPSKTGTYTIKIAVKDSKKTLSKSFSLNVIPQTLQNQSKFSNPNINIVTANTGAFYELKATGGVEPYKYKVSYKLSSESSWTYIVGNNSAYTTAPASDYFIPQKVGTYNFRFEVQDGNGQTAVANQDLNVTSNLSSNSYVTPTRITNKSTIILHAVAGGGSGNYDYKITYRIDDGDETDYGDWSKNKDQTLDLDPLFDDNYTGTMTIKFYIRDVGKTVTEEVKINIIKPSATEYSRQDLANLYNQVSEWKKGLNNDQRENLEGKEEFQSAFTDAFNAISSELETDYTTPYFNLQSAFEDIQSTDLSTSFFLTDAANAVSQWYTDILTAVGGWLTDFTSDNAETNSFKFDLQEFINTFSGVFMVFASALMILLFGVNVLSSAIQYQLFTLKGAVTTIARLFFAELWVQLSTKICVMVIKIFNELLASILAEFTSSVKTASIHFSASRSGVWLVGDILDFFVNLFPYLLVITIFLSIIIVFMIVYIKLVIRVLEIAMMIVVSPVFFACSVGEATMPYFKKFVSALIAVGAEIVFMAVVYIAYMWYISSNETTVIVQVYELYQGGDTVKNLFTYVAITLACGIMMIRPPRVLRELVN